MSGAPDTSRTTGPVTVRELSPGCSWDHTWSFTATGCPWQVLTRRALPPGARRRVLELVDAYEGVWSRFREDSLVSRAARGEIGDQTDVAARGEAGDQGDVAARGEAGTRGVPGPVVLDLPRGSGRMLALYDLLHRASVGRIDPLVGADLVELGYDPAYSFTVRDGALHRLGARRGRLTWGQVRRDGDRLTLPRPALVDVGAVGKGFLADMVADALGRAGVDEVVVDASGDLVVRSGTPVRLGLEEPGSPGRVIGVVTLRRGALAASGVSERAWGEGLHHVLDALTGLPVRDVLATWAVAGTCAQADGIATALFLTPPQQLAAAGLRYDFVLERADATVLTSRTFPRLGELFTSR